MTLYNSDLFHLNHKTTRTFSTEANLIKALEKLGFDSHRHLRVQNHANRWTAIFPASNIQDGNMTRYAGHGFMTIG